MPTTSKSINKAKSKQNTAQLFLRFASKMRQFLLLLGLSFVTCSTVASEECNQGSNSNCAIESEVAVQLPYGESSTRNM